MRRIAILAEGTLDFHHGKTATDPVKWGGEKLVAAVVERLRGTPVSLTRGGSCESLHEGR
jgi:hypothetical protein